MSDVGYLFLHSNFNRNFIHNIRLVDVKHKLSIKVVRSIGGACQTDAVEGFH